MISYYLVRDLSEFPQELGTLCAPMRLEDFYEAIKHVPAYALDSETSGLRPFHGDTIFALSFSDGVSAWYWERGGRPLPVEFQKLFADPTKIIYGHNIKFDAHHLYASFGVELAGTLHCTAIGARVEHNDRLDYSLGACLERIGLAKDDAVDKYVKEHGLSSKEEIPHKKEGRKLLHYDRVPREIMSVYALRDAYGTFHLAVKQLQRIQAVDALLPESPTGWSVVELERTLSPVTIRMERGGVLVDRKYCQEAIEFLSDKISSGKKSFREITGNEFTDSWQKLSKVFAGEQLKWGRTEKGNPSFGVDILQTLEHPAAKIVIDLRNEKSRVDFFATFLAEADTRGLVHPSFNSGGTATRRFSSSGPNFQNLTNDEDAPPETWSPRRALIAPDECCIVSMDYVQQEYFLLLDMAGEMDLIEQVKNGKDLHLATAELMSVTRKQAKTLNFLQLYGGGVAKLCAALYKPSVDLETLTAICFIYLYEMDKHEDYKKHLELVRPLTQGVIDYNMGELVKAKNIRELYFSKLPKVKALINKVIEVGEARGYVHNFAGQRYWCNKRHSYVLPNRIIQGGGADIGKRAMVAVAERLKGTRSRLFLPVHDELDFYMHRDDLHLCGEIKRLMEIQYPHRHLPMRVDVSHSWKNLGDLESGGPIDARAIGA
jgi:DNA polymerase I-like protein with 3'-5' exonuclease and polymerase domains